MEPVPIEQYTQVIEGLRAHMEIERKAHVALLQRRDAQLNDIVRLCEPFVRFEEKPNCYGQPLEAVRWITDRLLRTELECERVQKRLEKTEQAFMELDGEVKARKARKRKQKP